MTTFSGILPLLRQSARPEDRDAFRGSRSDWSAFTATGATGRHKGK